MKLILNQHVKKIGQRGDIVEVADGYANSFLIPRKLARVATTGDIQHLITTRQIKQNKKQSVSDNQSQLFDRLNKSSVTIHKHANEKGHLFAAVKPTDITEQIIGLRPEHLIIKNPIKELGIYSIDICVGKHKGSVNISIER